MKTRFLLAAVFAGGSLALHAAEPLTQSTFTEVVKDVNVVAASTKAAQAATINAVVKAPDMVRTGPESRAELTAPERLSRRSMLLPPNLNWRWPNRM